MAEAAAVFGIVAASIGLFNITKDKLTELVSLLKSYKQVYNDTAKAVDSTHKAIELLTKLQDGGRVTVLDSDTLKSINIELLETNSKLNKLVKRCQAKWYSLQKLTFLITANSVMRKLENILDNVENLHNRLESCHMMAKCTEKTVDTVVDLTQGLARLDIQQELHKMLVEFTSNPRQVMKLILCAEDIPFQISSAVRLLCENINHIETKRIAQALCDDYDAHLTIMLKLKKYFSNDEFSRNLTKGFRNVFHTVLEYVLQNRWSIEAYSHFLCRAKHWFVYTKCADNISFELIGKVLDPLVTINMKCACDSSVELIDDMFTG